MKTTKLFAYFTAVTFLLTPSCTYETVDESITVSDGGLKEDAPMPRGYSLSQDMVMDDPAIKTTLNGQTLGSEENAEQYTVQISVVQPPGSVAANGPPNLRAYIYWNTNGKQKTRWVSVGGGCAITGSAEAVTVQLQDFSGTPVDDNGNLPDYDVYVAAVPGSRPNSSTGPTLIPLESEVNILAGGATQITGGSYILPENGSVNLAVPPNVGVQSFYVNGGAYTTHQLTPVTTLLITQFDITDTVISSILWTPGMGFVPLAPQATAIILSNGATIGTLEGVSLTWGIEG